jgi:hypothetical protein
VIEKATLPNTPLLAAPLISPARPSECPAWVTTDQPAGSVIGPDHSPLMPHLDQWFASEATLPPGEQYTALPSYLRPTTQYHIEGTPRFLLEMEDELAFAA